MTLPYSMEQIGSLESGTNGLPLARDRKLPPFHPCPPSHSQKEVVVVEDLCHGAVEGDLPESRTTKKRFGMTQNDTGNDIIYPSKTNDKERRHFGRGHTSSIQFGGTRESIFIFGHQFYWSSNLHPSGVNSNSIRRKWT